MTRTSALTQTWKTSFRLSPTPNFAFKFLPWTQLFFNPKHPEMGWISYFYRILPTQGWQGEPSMMGFYIHTDLSHRSQQKVILFITHGQAKQTYSEISLCLCGAFYHFSQFFLLSICLEGILCSDWSTWSLSKTQSNLPYGALCTNPILTSISYSTPSATEPHPVVGLCQCLLTHSSAFLQTCPYQEFLQ